METKLTKAPFNRQSPNQKYTYMFQINITADEKLLSAINSLADAIRGPSGFPRPSVPVEEPSPVPTVAAHPQAEAEAIPPAPEKKRATKSKPAPRPEPEAVLEVAQVDPADEAGEVPSGVELLARFAPLKGTPHVDTLRSYMTSIGIPPDTRLKDVSDPVHLKGLDKKIDELVDLKFKTDSGLQGE